MKILVACEMSGRVRDALIARGHDAVSCDLLPSLAPGPHITGDVLAVIAGEHFDMMIAFPPCTFLCSSGLHWNTRRAGRQAETEKAIRFFMALWNAPIERIAIENPVGVMSTRFRKPSQIVHPWMFGDDASKATCLWLKGLRILVPTNELPGGRKARRANQREDGQNRLGESKGRAMLRSLTYPGIAEAMAEQWTPDIRQLKRMWIEPLNL